MFCNSDRKSLGLIGNYINYYFNEAKREEKMSEEEAKKYYAYLIRRNRIISIGKPLLGILVNWRINREQLNRVERDTFRIYRENITDGSIVYVQDWWIRKDHARYQEIREFLLTAFWLKEHEGCRHIAFERYHGTDRIRLIPYKKACERWLHPILRENKKWADQKQG